MTKSESDSSQADIGIVSALPIELGQLMDRCERVKHYKGEDLTFRGGRYDGIRIVVAESGMGYARARKASLALIDAHKPKWILSSGFSGALIPTMKIGQIVMANEIVDQHGQQKSINLSLESDIENGLYVGRILTADEIVRTVEQKQQLHENFEALAVDMESLAVAQVASETKTGFMAVRVISDDMSADLPPEVLSIIGDTGAVRVGAALTSIFNRPESVKDMLHLRTNAQNAAKSLATFLDGVVHQLQASN